MEIQEQESVEPWKLKESRNRNLGNHGNQRNLGTGIWVAMETKGIQEQESGESWKPKESKEPQEHESVEPQKRKSGEPWQQKESREPQEPQEQYKLGEQQEPGVKTRRGSLLFVHCTYVLCNLYSIPNISVYNVIQISQLCVHSLVTWSSMYLGELGYS